VKSEAQRYRCEVKLGLADRREEEEENSGQHPRNSAESVDYVGDPRKRHAAKEEAEPETLANSFFRRLRFREHIEPRYQRDHREWPEVKGFEREEKHPGREKNSAVDGANKTAESGRLQGGGHLLRQHDAKQMGVQGKLGPRGRRSVIQNYRKRSDGIRIGLAAWGSSDSAEYTEMFLHLRGPEFVRLTALRAPEVKRKNDDSSVGNSDPKLLMS